MSDWTKALNLWWDIPHELDESHECEGLDAAFIVKCCSIDDVNKLNKFLLTLPYGENPDFGEKDIGKEIRITLWNYNVCPEGWHFTEKGVYMFEIGTLVVTRGVDAKMRENGDFLNDVYMACDKYAACDWGKTCFEDAASNDEAVKNGNDRILAVYETCEGDIWIITEWDRSATTILFPEEY